MYAYPYSRKYTGKYTRIGTFAPILMDTHTHTTRQDTLISKTHRNLSERYVPSSEITSSDGVQFGSEIPLHVEHLLHREETTSVIAKNKTKQNKTEEVAGSTWSA
jgi:hypothetical protein